MIRRAAFLALSVAVQAVIVEPAQCASVRERVQGNHRLYVPEGVGRLPGVVAVPGCSGVSLDPPATDRGGGSPSDPFFRRHYPQMAERLKAHGYVVLLLDYLGGEGVVNACSGEVSPSLIADYIQEAVALLSEHPRVDSSRVHVVAWSLGGAGLRAHLQRVSTTPAPVFSSAVAIYPGCGAAQPWHARLPVLFLLGAADDITPARVCEALVARLPQASAVEVRRYANARHGFDVEDAPEQLSTGRGTTMGHNRGAAAASRAEISRFLSRR